MPKPDPECLESYERQGFESVVVWANQLWPQHGTSKEKRDVFAAAIDTCGLANRLTATRNRTSTSQPSTEPQKLHAQETSSVQL